MKIITGQPDDVPRIMPCARAFCAILNVDLDEAHYEREWRRELASGLGAMFLMEGGDGIVGGIGGTVRCGMLNRNPMAVEQFWYVNQEHRGGTAPIRLLRLFEDWARQSGCSNVAMIHMMDSMPETMEGIYLRLGYRLFEKQYIKNL